MFTVKHALKRNYSLNTFNSLTKAFRPVIYSSKDSNKKHINIKCLGSADSDPTTKRTWWQNSSKRNNMTEHLTNKWLERTHTTGRKTPACPENYFKSDVNHSLKQHDDNNESIRCFQAHKHCQEVLMRESFLPVDDDGIRGCLVAVPATLFVTTTAERKKKMSLNQTSYVLKKSTFSGCFCLLF